MKGFVAAVILALCLGLAAQEAQTPILLRGKALELPRGWGWRYDPPEALIRVNVLPDSSLGLIDILDGKDELESLIAEHLSSLRFALQEDNAREFTALLPLDQPMPEPSSSGEKTLLGELEEWITRQREFHSLSDGNPDTPIYRAGYFFTGLDEGVDLFTNRGFQRLGSPFSTTLYRGFWQDFYMRQSDGFHNHYDNESYSYGISASELQTGLGDYDHRFARGSLKKNDLLGVENLYAGFDFSVQNGWFGGIISALTALKFELKLPLWGTMLDLEYADYASDIPMTQLKSEYWLPTNFAIDHRFRQSGVRWETPVLDLALNHVSERARAAIFDQNLYNKTLQLQASRTLKLGALKLNARYEHAFAKQNFTRGELDYEDFAQADLELGALFLQGRIYDFERVQASARYLHGFRLGKLGPFASFVLNPPPALTAVNDIYLAGGSLFRRDRLQDHEFGLLGELQPIAPLALSLKAGMMRITNTAGGARLSRSFPFCDLSARLDMDWGDWNLSWQPVLRTRLHTGDLVEEPSLAWHSAQKLTRKLKHDNALFGGFSLTGHSDYTSANFSAFEVETSANFDLWAGVQITKRFELLLSYKNVGNGALFGAETVPASLHASLHWFFLN